MMRKPGRGGLHAAVGRVGDRWSLLIVEALLGGERRFGELRDDVGGVAPNILSARLKQLEHDGLVVARPYSARPPRFSYELTRAGSELGDALRLLASWGNSGAEPVGRRRHEVCGSELEVRWWCPGCDTTVDGDDAELHWV
jgi:DNA-binding HxlR family transcriptional regulator